MTVHPQKRMDIKKTLEAVMGRVLEVKETLICLPPMKGVQLHQPRRRAGRPEADAGGARGARPQVFHRGPGQLLEEREKYLDVLLKEAGIAPEAPLCRRRPPDTMTLESAIRVVQLNERGRQGPPARQVHEGDPPLERGAREADADGEGGAPRTRTRREDGVTARSGAARHG